MVSNLKKLRNAAGLTQQALADLSGTTQQNINKYEHNITEPPIEMLCTFAELLYTTIDYIVGRTDSDKPLPWTEHNILNDRDLTHIRKYRALSERQRDCIDSVMDFFADSGRSGENKE